MRIYKRLFTEERGAVAVISIDYNVLRLFVFFCLLLAEMHLLLPQCFQSIPATATATATCSFCSTLLPLLFIISAGCAECALLLLLPHFNPCIEGVSHLPRTHTSTAVEYFNCRHTFEFYVYFSYFILLQI